jgi:hypothetical protein
LLFGIINVYQELRKFDKKKNISQGVEENKERNYSSPRYGGQSDGIYIFPGHNHNVPGAEYLTEES